MKILLLLIPAIFLMAACSTAPIGMDYKHAVTERKANSIKTGVTTREEMDEMFGKPESKMRSENSTIYFYKDYNLNSVWVRFDENEIVTDFNWFD